MAAVRPASSAAGDRQAEPKLFLFPPVILPWDHELLLWKSPVFLTAAKDIDALKLFTRTCENCMFLFRILNNLPDVVASFYRRQCQRNFAFAVLHAALKVLSPDMYEHLRWPMVAHLRLYNLLGTVAYYQYTRHVFAAGTHVGVLDKILMYQFVRGSLGFMTARALFIGTGCMFSCLHAFPSVLPFTAEVLIQLVYLYYNFRYIAPISADVFSAPKYAAGVQQLCDALSHAMPTPQAIVPRYPASSPASSICGVQRAWVLVLFFQLFVGFLLPLYICYTYELTLKLRFLRQLRDAATARQHRTPPSTPASSTAQQQELQVAPHEPLSPPDVPLDSPHDPLGPPACRPSLTSRLHTVKGLLAAALARQRTPTGDPPRAPSTAGHLLRLLRSCLLHAAALSLLVALSWQLVVALHVPLVRHLKMLTFQEGYRQWYWELLCGTDQPCCPA